MGERTEVVIRTLTAGGAAALGAVNPALGIGAAMLKEPLDVALIRLADGVRDLRHRTLEKLFRVACDESGLADDVLIERIEQDDKRLLLAAEIVEASLRTTVQDKIVAFGRLLANAATDGSTVDTDRLLVGILALLEEPHLRLLNLLDTTPPPVKVQGIETTPTGWNPEEIKYVDEGLYPVFEMLIARLQSAGLVEDVGSEVSWSGLPVKHHLWATTILGRTTIKRLRQLSSGR